MKITISAQGVKRTINGPFQICASAEDLRTIRSFIDDAINDRHCYGWILIHDKSPIVSGEPEPWA